MITQSYPINEVDQYTEHPSDVEYIQMAEHMSFNTGNAIKYLWRADHENQALEDLKKARWHIDREISIRSREDQEEPRLDLTHPPAIPMVLPFR